MNTIRATQKLMRTATSRWCHSSPRTQVSLCTTCTGLASSSNTAATVLNQQQYATPRFMSSAATSMEPETVDVSLDQLRSSIAGGDYVRLLVKDNPYVDVVQYTHKNVIYNVNHVSYYSEALAIGITENGLIPGDVVLTFLPPHLCETVRSIAINWIFASCCRNYFILLSKIIFLDTRN